MSSDCRSCCRSLRRRRALALLITPLAVASRTVATCCWCLCCCWLAELDSVGEAAPVDCVVSTAQQNSNARCQLIDSSKKQSASTRDLKGCHDFNTNL